MKLFLSVLFLSVLRAPGASAEPASASSGRGGEPPPAATRAALERAADWQLAHPGSERMDGWVQGAFLAGLSALDGLEPGGRFDAALRRIGEANGWKPASTRYSVYNADDLCVGQMYAEMYLRVHDPKMIAALRARCDYILAHPRSGPLEFSPAEARNRYHWSWCDTLFMAPPVWVRLTEATGESAYREFAVEQWWKSSAYLYDRAEHLYFRDSNYFSKKEKNGQKVFWSRGNGWVLAGLARVLDYLPADHPARPRFEQQFREMAARLRDLQQADGFWRTSLLDPASFPLKEASGTGFLCFGLAWGVNHGLLERTGYAPAARRAWSALLTCQRPDGEIIQVQPIGAAPDSFAPDSTEPYGSGAFLLAGTEMYRLDGGGAN